MKQIILTRLPVSKEMKQNDFVQLCIQWNQENAWQRIEGIERQQDQYNLAYHEGPRTLKFADLEKYQVTAMRYETAGKDQDGHVIEAYLNRERGVFTILAEMKDGGSDSEHTSSINSVMALARLLIRSGMTSSDGDIALREDAVGLSVSSFVPAVNVILQRQSYLMPSVIVSKTSFGRPAVSPKKMAVRLAGLAHLLVQEEDIVASNMVQSCDTKAPHGGEIGIYNPDGSFRMFAAEDFESEKKLIEAVSEEVLLVLQNQTAGMLETYERIETEAARTEEQIVTVSKAKAGYEQAPQPKPVKTDPLKDLQKQVDQLQKQLAAAEKRANEAEEESAAFKEQVKQQQSQIAAMKMPGVLIYGNEQEFYPGEILSMALDAIAGACAAVVKGSRREHIYKDLIQANSYDNPCAEHARKIKNLMKGYSVMTGPIRNALEAEGYSISEEGKHCKLVWHNDPRYYTIVPKSGSDVRGGENITREMIRKFY